MGQFIFETQTRALLNNNGQSKPTNLDKNNTRVNGFNNLLTGMMQPQSNTNVNNVNVFQQQQNVSNVNHLPPRRQDSVVKNENPKPQTTTQVQNNNQVSSNNLQDASRRVNNDDVLAFNSPDSILSQKQKIAKSEHQNKEHHHKKLEHNSEVKETELGHSVELSEKEIALSKEFESDLEKAVFTVDSSKLVDDSQRIEKTEISELINNEELDNPQALANMVLTQISNQHELLDELKAKIAATGTNSTQNASHLKEVSNSNKSDISIHGQSGLVSQSEIDNLILANESQRQANSSEIDANKFELLKSLPEETFLLVKDLMFPRDGKKTSQTNASLNSKFSVLDQANELAGLTKQHALLDATDTILGGKEAANQHLKSDFSLTNGLLTDSELMTKQFAAAKGFSSLSELTELHNSNINFWQTASSLGFNNSLPSLSLDTPFTPNSSRWTDALNERVNYIINQKMNEIQLSLNPINLGPIEIKLNMVGSEMSLQFLTHQADIQHTLEKNMPQLQQMLADKGIALTQSSVQMVANNADFTNNQNQQSANNGTDPNQSGKQSSANQQQSSGQQNQNNASQVFENMVRGINPNVQFTESTKTTRDVPESVLPPKTVPNSENKLDLFA